MFALLGLEVLVQMRRYATIPEWGLKAWGFRNSLLPDAEDRSLAVGISSLHSWLYPPHLSFLGMNDDVITYRDLFPWANVFVYQHRVGYLSGFFLFVFFF